MDAATPSSLAPAGPVVTDLTQYSKITRVVWPAADVPELLKQIVQPTADNPLPAKPLKAAQMLVSQKGDLVFTFNFAP